MTRRLPLTLLCAAASLGCGSSEPQEERAEFRRPGLYEIRTRIGDTSGLRLSPEDEAELRAMFGNLPTERKCLSGDPPRIGGSFLNDRCRYTRAADRGTIADRSVVCVPEGGQVDRIELTGTTRSDGYALRILARRTDASTGRTISEMETFEEARRLGPCTD